MLRDGEILVVSCYELGRQPVAVAGALADLTRSGFAPRALDISVDRLDDAALRSARLVAISVPMHTALRLGVRVAARARQVAPAAHVCFFGLYATLNAAHLLAEHGDSCIGGETSAPLRLLAESLRAALEAGRVDSLTGRPLLNALPGIATARHAEGPWLPRAKEVRDSSAVPLRGALPQLSRYAQLEHRGERRLVAAVEATRGCKHLCRHCPIVPVYAGRFFAVPRQDVLADIEQQLAAGASHVTFGDPDFLNGPSHALELVRELHRRWPAVTFDATIKVEHLLQHRALLPELAATGCLFITTAVESLSDRVLLALDKGHTAAEVPVAVALVRAAGIDLRPTLLPYTPWTEPGDVRALFDFAEEHDLVGEIDPVQFTLRLLLPRGSPLAEGPPPLPDDDRSWLGEFDPSAFSYRWTHADARLDELQRASAALAAEAAGQGELPEVTFDKLRALVPHGGGRESSVRVSRPRREIPRLTEPWFC